MHWNIIGPHSHHRPGSTGSNGYGPSDVHRVRLAAATALYRVDALMHAADARRRAGSWHPDAAQSETDRDALNYMRILRGEHRSDGQAAIEYRTARIIEVRR